MPVEFGPAIWQLAPLYGYLSVTDGCSKKEPPCIGPRPMLGYVSQTKAFGRVADRKWQKSPFWAEHARLGDTAKVSEPRARPVGPL